MGKVMNAEVTRIQSKKALLRELFLYGIIGVSTAALDVILFKVFRTIGIPLLIANFMSVSTAVGSSFILNAKYNFKKTDNLHKRAAKFFSIGYFGWFVQSIILWIGVNGMGFRDTYVKLFAVFVAAAIQYVLNKFLTFRD
jgi:putative flippase GtrA